MPPKQKFGPPKMEQQEKKNLEDCIPNATRKARKWAFNVFFEWQISRNNKDMFKTVALCNMLHVHLFTLLFPWDHIQIPPKAFRFVG